MYMTYVNAFIIIAYLSNAYIQQTKGVLFKKYPLQRLI